MVTQQEVQTQIDTIFLHINGDFQLAFSRG